MVAVLSVRLCFWRINGKHKINILCVLCGSACPMKSPLHLFHRGGELSPLIFGTSIPARNPPKEQTVDNRTTAQTADTVNSTGNLPGRIKTVYQLERQIKHLSFRVYQNASYGMMNFRPQTNTEKRRISQRLSIRQYRLTKFFV